MIRQEKHTPGPWKAVPPRHCRASKYLCVQIGDDEMYSTLELLPADARLIAAAPDLLEALTSIIEIGKRDLSNPKYDGYFDTAHAAIAKAKASP